MQTMQKPIRPTLLSEQNLKQMFVGSVAYDIVPDKSLFGAMLYITDKLNELPKIESGEIFHLVQVSLQQQAIDWGVPTGQVADFLLVMADIGLVRCYKGGQHTKWEVCDVSFAPAFLSNRAIEKSICNVQERHRRTTEIRRRRENSERLEKYADTLEKWHMQFPSTTAAEVSVPVSTSSFEDEAIEALAEAERLGEELAKMTVQLAEVEVERDRLAQQLSERPQQAELVKQAFHDRLTALKQARG